MEEYRQQHPDSIASVIARNRQQQSGIKRPGPNKADSQQQGPEPVSEYILPFQVFYAHHVGAFKETLDGPRTELEVKLMLLERWNAMAPEKKQGSYFML